MKVLHHPLVDITSHVYYTFDSSKIKNPPYCVVVYKRKENILPVRYSKLVLEI